MWPHALSYYYGRVTDREAIKVGKLPRMENDHQVEHVSYELASWVIDYELSEHIFTISYIPKIITSLQGSNSTVINELASEMNFNQS